MKDEVLDNQLNLREIKNLAKKHGAQLVRTSDNIVHVEFYSKESSIAFFKEFQKLSNVTLH